MSQKVKEMEAQQKANNLQVMKRTLETRFEKTARVDKDKNCVKINLEELQSGDISFLRNLRFHGTEPIEYAVKRSGTGLVLIVKL